MQTDKTIESKRKKNVLVGIYTFMQPRAWTADGPGFGTPLNTPCACSTQWSHPSSPCATAVGLLDCIGVLYQEVLPSIAPQYALHKVMLVLVPPQLMPSRPASSILTHDVYTCMHSDCGCISQQPLKLQLSCVLSLYPLLSEHTCWLQAIGAATLMLMLTEKRALCHSQ